MGGTPTTDYIVMLKKGKTVLLMASHATPDNTGEAETHVVFSQHAVTLLPQPSLSQLQQTF